MKKMAPFFRAFLFGIYSTVALIFALGLFANLLLSKEGFLKYVDVYFDYYLPGLFFLMLWGSRYYYLRHKDEASANKRDATLY